MRTQRKRRLADLDDFEAAMLVVGCLSVAVGVMIAIGTNAAVVLVVFGLATIAGAVR